MAKRLRVTRYTDSVMGIESLRDFYADRSIYTATYETPELMQHNAMQDSDGNLFGKKYRITLTVQEIE